MPEFSTGSNRKTQCESCGIANASSMVVYAESNGMTTKDYVYLGLIALTAFAFYCNGFYAGVYRCKKMYESIFDDDVVTGNDAAVDPESAKSFAANGKPFAIISEQREQGLLSLGRELRGHFSNN